MTRGVEGSGPDRRGFLRCEGIHDGEGCKDIMTLFGCNISVLRAEECNVGREKTSVVLV